MVYRRKKPIKGFNFGVVAVGTHQLLMMLLMVHSIPFQSITLFSFFNKPCLEVNWLNQHVFCTIHKLVNKQFGV